MNVIDKQEVCGHCKAKSLRHPWVIVTRVDPDDAESPFQWLPICSQCHINPTRHTFRIKGHYFPRQQAEMATRMAGSSSLG